MKLKEWIDDPKFSQKTIKAAMLLVTFTVALIYIVFHLEQAGSFFEHLVFVVQPIFAWDCGCVCAQRAVKAI